MGSQQSPINLVHPVPSAIGHPKIDWHPGPLDIINNGHTIQANVEPGNVLLIGDGRYELKQFHFHHPSEHTLSGSRLAMEAHFVHAGPDGGFAVLGVFLVPGAANAAIDKLWARMPKSEGKQHIDEAVDVASLLPAVGAYYRYAGSLTTPPCSETVLWTVFAEPIQVSQAQIDTFAAIFPMNARPLQKLNRRFLLGSF